MVGGWIQFSKPGVLNAIAPMRCIEEGVRQGLAYCGLDGLIHAVHTNTRTNIMHVHIMNHIEWYLVGIVAALLGTRHPRLIRALFKQGPMSQN